MPIAHRLVALAALSLVLLPPCGASAQWEGGGDPQATPGSSPEFKRQFLNAADAAARAESQPAGPEALKNPAPPRTARTPDLDQDGAGGSKPRPARARTQRAEGLSGLRIGRMEEPAAFEDTGWAFAYRVSMLSLDEASPVATRLDLELGSTSTWGFLYDLEFLLGFAGRLGSVGALGVLGGGGLGGVTGGRLPFAWQVPVEAFVTLDLGDWLHLHTWARSTWLFGTGAERLQGPQLYDLGDELALGLAFTFGESDAGGDEPGFYLGALYQELLGSRMISLLLGFGMVDRS